MSAPNRPIRLHRTVLSGHCHRVELFLSLLGLPYELIDVDPATGRKTTEFLAMNPFGQVPVIQDGPVTLFDSNAILLYLAARYDTAQRWLPQDPVEAAHVYAWLGVAAGHLARGPATARIIKLFGAPLNYEQAKALSLQLFGAMEAHLSGRNFLVGAAPTLADLALYSYTSLAPEGGISVGEHPRIRDWLARVEALPGFVPMRRSPPPKVA